MLCLSSLTVLPCTPLEQIDAALGAGFDAVDLRLVPAMATDIDVMADAALRRAIERRLAASGLRVVGFEVLRIGPDTDIAALQPVLRYAGDLGARSVVVTSLPVQGQHAADEAGTARKLGELGELAARHGLRPLIEFMVYRGIIGGLEAAARVAALAGHPNIGICLDALHLHRSGGTPASLERIDRGLIGCLQLCDAPWDPPQDLADEARYDRLYPGEGQLPLHELIRAVPAHLPISVEVPNRARAGLSVAARADEAARRARAVIERARRA